MCGFEYQDCFPFNLRNRDGKSAPVKISEKNKILVTMLQLHFSKDSLPDSVSNDFQNLNKFSEQVSNAGTQNYVINMR